MAVTLRFMMKRAVMLLVAYLFCFTGGGLVDAGRLAAANISPKAVSSLTSNPPVQYRLKCPDHVIETPEGGTVPLQCSLHPPLDLTSYTLDVKRSDLPVNGEVVFAYRNGRDYPDPQMPMYKNRVALVHDDLPRGMVTVQIYPVNLSDSGQYKFFISKLKIGSYVNLAVVSKPESFNSSSITPSAEDPVQYRLKCPDHVIEAPEGDPVPLQCSLHPPLDLTSYTLDVKRSDLPVNGEVVCAYRNGRDNPDPEMPMYKNRVILVHNDLPRGMVTVQIYPVNLSDSGQYKFFISKLKIGSYVNLAVVSKPESFNSSSITPSAEDPVQYRLKCPDHVIEAPEGDPVTLQCSLHPPLDLTSYTLDVKRSDLPVNGEVVCAYRNGRDNPDPEMPMYKNRVILVHNDLPRGMVTVQIYPVNLSDSGQYKFFISKLKIGSYVNLAVVSKPESLNSSSITPSAEDHVHPKKEEIPVWKIIVSIVVPILVIAAGVCYVIIYKCKQKNRGRREGQTDENSYL